MFVTSFWTLLFCLFGVLALLLYLAGAAMFFMAERGLPFFERLKTAVGWPVWLLFAALFLYNSDDEPTRP